MKTVSLGPFAGINNRVPDTRLSITGAGGGKTGDFLRNAVNVDLTSKGTLRRRKGSEKILSGTDVRSLWNNGDDSYFADGAQLRKLNPDNTSSVIDSVTPRRNVSYAAVLDDVYWSDGVVLRRIANGVSSDAGVPVPNPYPVVTSGAGGSLPEGLYQVAFTAVVSGEESGLTWSEMEDVPANGRIDVTGIPSGRINVYMTPPNGDALFLVTELNNASSISFTVTPVWGRQAPTFGLRQMPAGHIVRYSNGRLLVAAENILYHSEPYAPALHNPMRGYTPFPARITVVEPCKNGVYVVADKTYWLAGEDIEKAEVIEALPYGAVEGTGGLMENTENVWWFSKRGIVVGDPNGQVQNIQENAVAVDSAVAGASLYREQDGMRQAITSLFGTDASIAAATSYMSAEIIRKGEML